MCSQVGINAVFGPSAKAAWGRGIDHPIASGVRRRRLGGAWVGFVQIWRLGAATTDFLHYLQPPADSYTVGPINPKP